MWTRKAVQKGFPKGCPEFQSPKPIYRDLNNWPVFKKAEHDFGGSVGTWLPSNGGQSDSDS